MKENKNTIYQYLFDSIKTVFRDRIYTNEYLYQEIRKG